ncbi:peptidylprolyl isomerase, partial [Haematococcus lacustris]
TVLGNGNGTGPGTAQKRIAPEPVCAPSAKKAATEAARQQQQKPAAAGGPAGAGALTPGGKAGEGATKNKDVRRWDNGFEIHDISLGPPNGKLAKAGKKV